MIKIKSILLSVLNLIYSTNLIRVIRFLKNGGWKREIWGEGLICDNVDHAIKKFCPNSGYFRTMLLRYRLIREYLNRQVTPEEYFLFDFPHRSNPEKDSFLTDQWKDRLSMKATDYEVYRKEVKDKYAFFKLNEKWFNRGMIIITREMSFDMFDSFAKKENRIFVKPINGSYGRGAFVYDYNPNNIRHIYGQLLASNTEYVAEGYINQSAIMAAWNESSVNTVRVPTILSEKGFHVLGCFMRTGRVGSIIDNAGGGGILAAIDDKSGVVISDGFSEDGRFHTNHPDSNLVFKGFQIPSWKELLTIAETAHRSMPHQRYIAYDFAHTNNGWVMVEGNWGQFLSQFASGVGIKKEFFEYMQE